MKNFIAYLLTGLLVLSFLPVMPVQAAGTGINLVPAGAGTAPNTFSSWWIQGAEQYAQMSKTGKTLTMRDVVTDDFLFNHSYGWCYTQYPSVRKDMIFVVCDGWELPDSEGGTVSPDNYFGSQVFDAEKFPGYGDTPQERLKTYADKVKEAGWKGAGLWICAQEDAANRPASGYDEDFWTQRILWSKFAGITYWEIDWGTLYNNLEWRRFISDMTSELYPELVIEHITGAGGLNDENNSGRVTAAMNRAAVEVAGFSDVFRTYDVTTQLTNATTLERVGKLLQDGYTLKGDYMGLVCAEDQAYINASLGLTNMVFRNSMEATNTDESARALRWARIAPAFELSAYDTVLSEEALDDYWEFRDGDTWYSNVTGKTIHQYAPAVISRGIGQAQVTVQSGLKPFVTASRNPNGAISVATLGRTQGRSHSYELRADVTLPVGALTGPVGIFGYYNSLTLQFDTELTGKHILAQDLLANEAQDITSRVTVNGSSLTLSGALLKEIGLSARSWSGDTSQPGLVLQIGESTDYAPAPAVGARADDPESIVPVFENASFEASNVGTPPAGWSFWRSTGTTESTIVTASGGHTGTKSCLISAAAAHEGSLGQTFTSIPNGIYAASVWIKGTKNNGGINFSAVYGPGDYIAESLTGYLGDGLAEWTKVTLNNIKVTNGQIELQVYYNASAGEELWLDDFELQLLQQTGKQCTVTLFDSSNGTVIEQLTVTAGEVLPQPDDPVKSGYTFLGWTVNGQPWDFSQPITHNLVLTANWQNDNPDEEEKVNRPVWDMEALPDDMSSFITTGWGERELGDYVDAVQAAGKGTNGTTALGYTYNRFNTADNGGNVLQIALGETCGADKFWQDGGLLWFWIDAREFTTPLLVDINLNWNSLAYGTHAYSWDGKGAIVDMGAMPGAWSNYTGASRVQLKPGYCGWVGVPLAGYPSVNLADVNTLILYFEVAQDQNALPKTAYFDNFWLTDFGHTPVCKHEKTSPVSGKPATCTEAGLQECLHCNICGRLLTNNLEMSVLAAQLEIEKLGHDIVADTAVSATCTENGLTAGEHCSRCDYRVAQTETEKLGHDYIGAVTKEPTESEEGERTFTCSRCNDSYTETLDKVDCPSKAFADVQSSKWYHEAVDFVISNGVMKGTSETSFAPEAKFSRAMLAQVLYNLEESPAVQGNNPFSDVTEGKWYYNAVLWAAQNSIVEGYTNGDFGVNDPITREQMACMLGRYAAYKKYDTTALEELSGFEDAGQVSSWALKDIRWAVAAGYISGKTVSGATLLDPAGNATRAEVASLMMRFIRDNE